MTRLAWFYTQGNKRHHAYVNTEATDWLNLKTKTTTKFVSIFAARQGLHFILNVYQKFLLFLRLFLTLIDQALIEQGATRRGRNSHSFSGSVFYEESEFLW